MPSKISKTIINKTVIRVDGISKEACTQAVVDFATTLAQVDHEDVAAGEVEWSTDRDGDFLGACAIITIDHERNDANRARDKQRQPALDELNSEPNPIQKLCGYVENGTETVVQIWQDDATRDWLISVGQGKNRRTYNDKNFNGVVAKAMAEHKES